MSESWTSDNAGESGIIAVNDRDWETEFMGDAFVSVKLQDSTVAERLAADVEATLREAKINSEALSPMETMLRYASVTSDNISGQAMLDSVDVDAQNEYITIDPATGEEYEVKKSGEIDQLTFNVKMSKKFAGDIALNAVKTPLSPAANIFSGVLDELKDIQVQARSSTADRDWETSLTS